jgi:glycosyltransferase involved in cell wall biosynthesis
VGTPISFYTRTLPFKSGLSKIPTGCFHGHRTCKLAFVTLKADEQTTWRVSSESQTNGISPHDAPGPDLLVFSHLRWDFVFQRPQHLVTRFAKKQRVFFIEEALYTKSVKASVRLSRREGGLCIVTPELPLGTSEEVMRELVSELLTEIIQDHQIQNYLSWYYTPMALPFSRHLKPIVTVYDCMDELSLFKGAHPELLRLEQEMYRVADVMFTGGRSLFEYKRQLHSNIHPFPSSIDRQHFMRARRGKRDPDDQKNIPHFRIGFAGVIDERLDIELLGEVARLRPEWNWIMIGPVVKIDVSVLPKMPNIHYLGAKAYETLPDYISGWDVAMLPFARNDSTRFISPTKTPEYLAAGRPVVSTSIRDVVDPYGMQGFVRIADKGADFVEAVEAAWRDSRDVQWLSKVDAYLASNSWDSTFARMKALVDQAFRSKVATGLGESRAA